MVCTECGEDPRLKIQVQRLDSRARMPGYMTADASGLDLYALLSADDADLTVYPGERKTLATGIALAVPSGYEGQIRPRSGLAARHGVTILNTPGTIDADYRGEILVVMINLSPVKFVVRNGDRIAQLVVAPVAHVRLVETDALPETGRGDGGFGSTGR